MALSRTAMTLQSSNTFDYNETRTYERSLTKTKDNSLQLQYGDITLIYIVKLHVLLKI